MRFPPLTRIVRVYLKSIDQGDAPGASIARAAMARVAAQKPRIEDGLAGTVLDFLAAHMRGDKEEVERHLALLREMVRPRHDDDGGSDGHREVAGEGDPGAHAGP